MKSLIYLILSCGMMQAQAQALQFEAFVSGGVNVSHGYAAEGFWQPPFPTLYAQGNLGYWVSDQWGFGAGLTYFPIGISRRFFPPEAKELEMSFFSSKATWVTYDFMPHLYLWYALPDHARIFPHSQFSLGMLYARWLYDIGFGGNIREYTLSDGRILYRQSSSTSGPHTFLALETRWDLPLWRSRNHGLFGVLHLIKGINPIRTTTDAYSVGTIDFEDQSKWVTRGDYLGIGVSYKWRYWNF